MKELNIVNSVKDVNSVNSVKDLTVDEQMQELAKKNWNEFKKLTGIDVNNFIICSSKKKGKSITQISIATKIKRTKVHRTICKVCP